VKGKACFALLCLLVLVFVLSDCGVPREEYDTAVAEMARLQSEVENLQSERASLQGAMVNLQEELNTPDNERIRKLQDELTDQTVALDRILDTSAALQAQVGALENELEAITDTAVMLHYQFETSRWGEQNWMLTIPLRDYLDYRESPRPFDNRDNDGPLTTDEIYHLFARYCALATDPGDDYLIGRIIDRVNEVVTVNDLSNLDTIEFVLRFVQSLTYTDDLNTTSRDEYPRYPMETLFDRGGDCEDTSILLAAILTEMGYDVALLLFEEFDHMGLGINFPVEYGNSWIYDGRRYWYLDTTGGQSIGWCPRKYVETSAYVFPVR
jgi:predicted transglutaminase-like cysteine proteinase